MNDREPKYNRRSIRLKEFDYTTPWWYYVTICAYKRNCLFGRVVNNEVIKNEIGEVSEQCWEEIPAHFPHVALDEFIIMPNHIHGIIIEEGQWYGLNMLSPYKQNVNFKILSLVR